MPRRICSFVYEAFIPPVEKFEFPPTIPIFSRTIVFAPLLAASVALITLLPGWTKTEAERSFFGAFLLPSEAGGYVLAGVLAFALGVAVTIFCLYLRKRSERKGDPPAEEEEETG